MRARFVVALALLALAPAISAAQQTNGVIAGLVRDATGGVLPGVTVEVASPALIERTRSVVTGDDGQYRIVELRPGVYSITFTLSGFASVKREGVEVTTGFTATVNAEMKVGDLAETITVSGASPVVDVQNVTQQSVLTERVLESIPSGRSYTAIGKLVAGVDSSGNSGGHDVGGTTGRDATKLISHGSSTNAFKLLIDGMPQMTWIADGSVGVPPSDDLAEEINLQHTALPAEHESGGVLFNIVPKAGGNLLRTSFFGNAATRGMQSENLTEALRAQGLASSGTIDYITDVRPSVGGPLQQDRLWFFVTYRDFRPYQFSPVYYDTNPGDWVYTPDLNRPAPDRKPQWSLNSRITWQATPRNRFNLGLEVSRIFYKDGWGVNRGNSAPEAVAILPIEQKPVVALSWTSPVTNRLLIDAGGQVFRGRWWGYPLESAVQPGALEIGTGITFRANTNFGVTGYNNTPFWHDFLRGAMSYTTGSHAIKVGGNLWHGGITYETASYGGPPYSVRLLNGMPNGVVYLVDPNSYETRFLKSDIFAQDQWTIRGLTFNYGVRIDTIDSGYPAQHLPATAYFGPRDFAAETIIRRRDWSPRLGVAYDVFGNGKTAVKASISRYVDWDATQLALNVNPANTSAGNLQRTWNDTLVCPTCAPGDFIPQGDPTNPLANGEIGPSPNATWGTPRLPSRYDPEWSRGGWGVRGYNWEQSVSVQQELRSNVSLNVGYFYRKFGNFPVTDNVAVGPSDFDSFCVTGPRDSRLPNGGGARICGLYDVKPAKVSSVDNLTTLATNYGDIYQDYRGIDATINIRRAAFLLQGGVSSGRERYDFCDVVDELPEMLISGGTKMPADHCRQQQPWLTQLKLIGSYDLPWALNIAAAYQNSYNTTSINPNLNPGSPRMGIASNYVATNVVIAPELGRNLAAGANATATINVVTPGTMWGDRLQQLDLRLARTFRAGRASIKAMIDLYNVLNANTIHTFNNTYGTTGAAWLQPLGVLQARLVKLGIQVDY